MINLRLGSAQILNIGGGYSNYGLKFSGLTEPTPADGWVTEGNLVDFFREQSPNYGVLDIRNWRGANELQLTEGFVSVNGQVRISNSTLSVNPPNGGRVFLSNHSSGTMKLVLDNYNFGNNIIVGIKESGFDTLNGCDLLSVVTRLGGLKGYPDDRPFSISPCPFGAIGGFTTSSNKPGVRDVFAVSGADVGADISNLKTLYANSNSLYFGDGQIEVGGLHAPQTPSVEVIGTAGATLRRFKIIARDSLGNRTISTDRSGNHAVLSNSPATLDATNFLRFTWPSQLPAPADYQLIDVDPSNQEQGRIVATFTPIAGMIQVHDLTTTPSGSYVPNYYPARNEAAYIQLRSRVAFPVEITFTANDTTPSVAQASDFVTANSIGTSITTFDDGITGQLLRVRVNDSNTTFVNGANIITTTGANVVGTNGRIYQFIRRGSSWIML
jgi:hypothetical protein